MSTLKIRKPTLDLLFLSVLLLLLLLFVYLIFWTNSIKSVIFVVCSSEISDQFV